MHQLAALAERMSCIVPERAAIAAYTLCSWPLFSAMPSTARFAVVAFHFDDMTAQAGRILAEAKANAARIVAKANKEADSIRREAAEAGCQAAMQAVENVIAEKTATAIEALQQAAADHPGDQTSVALAMGERLR